MGKEQHYFFGINFKSGLLPLGSKLLAGLLLLIKNELIFHGFHFV